MKKIKTALYTLRIIIKYCNAKFINDIVYYSAKNTLITINSVWFLKKISEFIVNSDISFEIIIKLLLVMLAVNTIFDVYEAVYVNCLSPIMENRAKNRLRLWAVNKAMRIPVGCYEQTEYYQNLVIIERSIKKTIWDVNNALTQLIGFIVAMISAVIVVNSINPILNVFLIFAIPNAILVKKNAEQIRFLRSALIEHDNIIHRMLNYSTNKLFAKKARLSKISDAVMKHYDEAVKKKTKLYDEYGNKIAVNAFLIRFSSLTVVQILAYAIALIGVVYTYKFSLADFSVVFMAVVNVISRMNKIISKTEFILNKSNDVNILRKFENFPEEDYSKGLIPSDFETLEFKNVSFGYNEKMILNDVSLKIQKGKKVAIVGKNGEGKSSILKLICRFYKPDSGMILYNGVDIEKYNILEYREKIANVFQNYNIYNISLMENVTAGKQTIKREDVKKLMEKLELTEYIDDVDRIIGNEYDADGLVLSGGTMKKLAIVRAFCKKADIVLLDEPDAALDVVVIDKLMHYIKNCQRGKTIVYVTHNMSVARRADEIVVLSNGGISESGNHDTLIELKKEYFKLYNAQADNYKK